MNSTQVVNCTHVTPAWPYVLLKTCLFTVYLARPPYCERLYEAENVSRCTLDGEWRNEIGSMKGDWLSQFNDCHKDTSAHYLLLKVKDSARTWLYYYETFKVVQPVQQAEWHWQVALERLQNTYVPIPTSNPPNKEVAPGGDRYLTRALLEFYRRRRTTR